MLGQVSSTSSAVAVPTRDEIWDQLCSIQQMGGKVSSFLRNQSSVLKPFISSLRRLSDIDQQPTASMRESQVARAYVISFGDGPDVHVQRAAGQGGVGAAAGDGLWFNETWCVDGSSGS
jgi:hypothetical protein